MGNMLSYISESFPDISNKAAWCALLAGGIVELLSFFVKPLKREDRFGHLVARILGLIILMLSLTVIVFDLSLWWLLIGFFIPPIWLALRWYGFSHKLKRINKQKKDHNIFLYDYVDSLSKKKLFEWEIKRFFLPYLRVFYDIGAIKRLKTEIGNLKDYQDSEEVKELQIAICSNVHRPQKMIDILKPKVIKHKSKPTDKDYYPIYLNNLYHAAMMQEDSVGIEYAFGKMECYVAAESDINRIPIEMLEAMMYRYDTANNEQGVSRTLAMIKSREPKSFSDYLYLNDIILYYNKRHNNRKGIIDYFDEVYAKLDEMENDEEQKLRFRLRMVQFHFEYNYGWKEITMQLFKDAEIFLSYSQDIAEEYVKMVAGALRDASSMYGQMLLPEQNRHLVTQAILFAERYLHDHREQLFECSDEFLYRKCEAYRFLIDLARLKSLVSNDFYQFIKQMIESYEKIIELCLKNEEKSEYIHTIMVYLDEFIVQSEVVNMYIGKGVHDDDILKVNKLIQSTSPRIRDLFDTYKGVLAESNFDRAFAYNTLYAAHFSMCFGNKDDAEFYLSKFEDHGISIKNYRAPIQFMYQNLKTALN